MSEPKLIAQAKSGQGRLFVQFGGQGAPWYKELAKYYKDPAMKKFFDMALKALEEEKSRVDGTVGLPNGLDARAWLEDETKIPSDDYLACAAVSIPMIQVTQLAHFENAVNKGLSRKSLVEASSGTSGHSQGLIPASLVALSFDGDEYYANASKYIKYLLYLGVRAQETHPFFAPTPEEIERSEKVGNKAPAPMMAVVGDSHATVQAMVDATNKTLPADKKIYISLYNSPSNRILSSFRSSLVTFNEMHNAALAEKKIKAVYLRTSCPFHCALMEPIRPSFEADIKRLGFSYPGSALKIPVYSFYDGRDLRKDADIAIGMYLDMAINPLYWDKSMKPVADDAGITTVIDFGPGKTSQRLSEETLQGLGATKTVLAAALPKELETIVAQ
ncbi:MAG: ACP S-malonyltransferase [Leptospirales bacterium]|nr:ACP S-malonyltransferase [Leptospirales bacterium]